MPAPGSDALMTASIALEQVVQAIVMHAHLFQHLGIGHN